MRVLLFTELEIINDMNIVMFLAEKLWLYLVLINNDGKEKQEPLFLAFQQSQDIYIYYILSTATPDLHNHLQ